MIVAAGDTTLYHASYTVIEKIDLAKCRKRNDFGQGFYLTTDKQQAMRFVKTAIKKTGKNLDTGFVNIYTLNMAGLKMYEFVTTNHEWLHCVCDHRRFDISEPRIAVWDAYDILAGKIANDDTMTVINIYIAGGYGDYGSENAIHTAITLLKPERLKDQLCIRTQGAVEKLRFEGCFEVQVK
ncbi:hypothetical protein FACS189485_08320 [Spirochaetia bacterium]|nr:hypothetical protein FACS189485_08320 [Spirochaetia bacterium]